MKSATSKHSDIIESIAPYIMFILVIPIYLMIKNLVTGESKKVGLMVIIESWFAFGCVLIASIDFLIPKIKVKPEVNIGFLFLWLGSAFFHSLFSKKTFWLNSWRFEMMPNFIKGLFGTFFTLMGILFIT